MLFSLLVKLFRKKLKIEFPRFFFDYFYRYYIKFTMTSEKDQINVSDNEAPKAEVSDSNVEDKIPKYFAFTIPYRNSLSNPTITKFQKNNDLTYDEVQNLIANDIVLNSNYSTFTMALCRVNYMKTLNINDDDIDECYLKFEELSSHLKGNFDIKFLKIEKKKHCYFLCISYLLVTYNDSIYNKFGAIGHYISSTGGYNYDSKFPCKLFFDQDRNQQTQSNISMTQSKIFNGKNYDEIIQSLDEIIDMRRVYDVKELNDMVMGNENTNPDDEKEKVNDETEKNKLPYKIIIKIMLLLYYNYVNSMNKVQIIKIRDNYYYSKIEEYPNQEFIKEIFEGIFEKLNALEKSSLCWNKYIKFANNKDYYMGISVTAQLSQRLYYTNTNWDEISVNETLLPITEIIKNHVNLKETIYGDSLFYIDKKNDNSGYNYYSYRRRGRSGRYQNNVTETYAKQVELDKYFNLFKNINSGINSVKFTVRFDNYWVNGEQFNYIVVSKYLDLNKDFI